MTTSVSFENVCKSFLSANGNRVVLENFSLELQPGAAYAIVGPNGSGKSSLLDLAAGFSQVDAGAVRFGSSAPRIAMISQNYRESLLPWLSVRDNILWPIDGDPTNSARLAEVLNFVDQRTPLSQRAGTLSGGQSQLVALARAWAFLPDLLICDEPFSALDVVVRQQLTDVMARFCARDQVTSITVTHAIQDAIMLANTILVVSGPPLRIIGKVVIEAPLPRCARFRQSANFARALAEADGLIEQISTITKRREGPWEPQQ